MEEVKEWGTKLVVVLLPSHTVPEEPGWHVLKEYPAESHLFQRPAGREIVLCKGSGIAWTMAAYTAGV